MIVVYVRARCPLCDEVLDALRGAGVTPRVVDVDGDPGLAAEYSDSVPVVEMGGTIVHQAGESLEGLLESLPPPG